MSTVLHQCCCFKEHKMPHCNRGDSVSYNQTAPGWVLTIARYYGTAPAPTPDRKRLPYASASSSVWQTSRHILTEMSVFLPPFDKTGVSGHNMSVNLPQIRDGSLNFPANTDQTGTAPGIAPSVPHHTFGQTQAVPDNGTSLPEPS